MIQIKRNGIFVTDDGQIESLRQEFEETRCMLLPGFLEPFILRHLLKRFESTRFVTKYEISREKKFGETLFVPQEEPIIFTFHLLLNNPKLFRVLERITDCELLGNFTGRMHRSAPEEDHSIDWHEDNSNHRVLGMTLELSSEKYTGGKFQLREIDSGTVLREISGLNAGDAFIFRISPDLQHRLTKVESGGHRSVGVGWFCSQPDWPTFARSYLQPSKIPT